MEITITVKTIKKMLGDELGQMYQKTHYVLCNAYVCDAAKEMLCNGYNTTKEMLDKAETFEDLEEIVSFAGYRMSLQEWLNSY